MPSTANICENNHKIDLLSITFLNKLNLKICRYEKIRNYIEVLSLSDEHIGFNRGHRRLAFSGEYRKIWFVVSSVTA